MKRLIVTTVLVCTAAAALGAQQPRAMERRGGGGGAVEEPAEFLLGHTGELRLTDAQVTRLAAIARRSADRRRSLRAQMDSMRPERTPGARPDSAARDRMRQRFEQMRPAMDRVREQSQADRRDAIAVLTPDQQAQAWERIAARGRGQARGMQRRGQMPGTRMQGGGQGRRPGRMGPPDADGRRPEPRPRRSPDDRS